MSEWGDAARELVASGRLAHLVTVNRDGSPQISIVWAGLEDDEVVIASLDDRQKLRNIRRDPRVALSIETDHANPYGLTEYLVVHGSGRVTEGGAAALLQRLAQIYIGPGVSFPPGEDHPPGHILRIRPERVGGVGPWAS